MMPRGIAPVLSPELPRIPRAVGRGDAIVIGDANFPAEASAQRRFFAPPDEH